MCETPWGSCQEQMTVCVCVCLFVYPNVCLRILCLAACVCVSFNSLFSDSLPHVSCEFTCLCLSGVCVSVCFQKGERGVTHSAVLPTILPPGDKDASAYISRYGYRRKRCADVTHLVCSCVTSSTFEPSLHHRPITAYYHGNSHNP